MNALHQFLYKDRVCKFETEFTIFTIEYDLYCIVGIIVAIATVVWMCI